MPSQYASFVFVAGRPLRDLRGRRDVPSGDQAFSGAAVLAGGREIFEEVANGLAVGFVKVDRRFL
jgi:hypothetical protein